MVQSFTPNYKINAPTQLESLKKSGVKNPLVLMRNNTKLYRFCALKDYRFNTIITNYYKQ